MQNRLKWVWGLIVGAGLGCPSVLWANPYDISLRGLGRPETNSMSDPAVQRYRNLANEISFALAPRPLAPAETLGMSGFEFSLASVSADISQDADYWIGQPGSPVLEGALPTHGRKGVPSMLWVPTVHLRKGLPLSTELGISGGYLARSEMTMLGAEAKVALHESYFRWAPAVALRLAAGRLFGSSDLDLFTFETDLVASLPFGVGGMAQVTPFAGYGWLFGHINSLVIDETPYEVLNKDDQKGGPTGSLYTFPTIEWKDNRHGRLVLGCRVNAAMIEVLYELDLGFFGGKIGTLQSHSFKLGLDV